MSTATLTREGRVTIPADVRPASNVQTGDRVEFVQVQPGGFDLVVAARPVREPKGMFGKPARSLAVDDMNRVVAGRGAKAGLRTGCCR